MSMLLVLELYARLFGLTVVTFILRLSLALIIS